MIQKIAVSLLFLITISAFSQQEKINNYKYIIVPDKFDFFKTSDQHQTSSLTKFLLAKKGFVVFLSTDKNIPKELFTNKCLALTATLIDDSSLFMVKNKIELKDCYGTILYTSAVGKSKEKDYKKSYHEAIRNAYNSMEDLVYNFIPKKENTNTEKVMAASKVVTIPIAPVMEEVALKKNVVVSDVVIPSVQIETLYAQAIANGFQLVNTTPTIIFQVFATKRKDVFIIKDKNGIMYKNENIWVAEYYEKGQLVIKKYRIKF
jgi:hypothetical protein